MNCRQGFPFPEKYGTLLYVCSRATYAIYLTISASFYALAGGGDYAFTSSVPLSVPYQCLLAVLAIGQQGQHAVRASESIPVPTWTRPQTGKSIYACKNGTVRKTV